jgi:hypothetical protein
VVLALLTPRLVVALPGCSAAGSRHLRFGLWPVLGFVFLPTTLLWYTAVQHWFAGQWTFWPVVGLVVALLVDLSPAGGRRRRAAEP